MDFRLFTSGRGKTLRYIVGTFLFPCRGSIFGDFPNLRSTTRLFSVLLMTAVLGCSRSSGPSAAKNANGPTNGNPFADAENRENAGDFIGALAMYEAALATNADDPFLLLHVARTAYKLKRPDRGISAIYSLLCTNFPGRDYDALLALKAEFEDMKLKSGQAEPTKLGLSDAERRKYEAITLIVEEAERAKDSKERRVLLYDIIEKSGEFLAKRQDILDIWALEAAAAAELGESKLASFAGQRLLAAKDINSDSRIQKVMVMLERKNLLSDSKLFTYPEGLAETLKSAQLGGSLSQFSLGLGLNREGLSEDARFWYRQAADQGLVSAQFCLGLEYQSADSAHKDYVEAMRWYCKAARRDDTDAQYWLGKLYYYDYSGVPRDYAAALEWFRKAAANGGAGAQAFLGVMYENGQAVAEDKFAACDWYRKAAERGNALGQLNLGMMYFRGEGVEKDQKQAVFWIRKAAEHASEDGGNLAQAQYNLGVCYQDGFGVDKDLVEAARWYRKAAANGSRYAKEEIERLEK